MLGAPLSIAHTQLASVCWVALFPKLTPSPCFSCLLAAQALGLRALWRVNSLSDRHEPLELLTNDLPQVGARTWHCQMPTIHQAGVGAYFVR